MEHNNGKGIFYGVIGVATLIVAIIGATFAYFSASAEAQGDTITGQTNEDIAGALSLTVDKLFVQPEESTVNPNLVPSNIDGTAATITPALAASCIDDGYTGCHVYKITASSTQTVPTASINLESLTVDAAVKTNWAYAIYTGTDTVANTVVTTAGFDRDTAYDMHNAAGMTANEDAVYYLIVYLKNIDENQAGEDKEYGTYNGTVSFNVAGGKVSATFSAAG